MNAQNELQHSLPNSSLGKRTFQGAAIALVLTIIFLSIMFPIGGVLTGKNFWQGVWEFFPLVTVTFGGALGGMVYYLMVHVWRPGGWKKVLATIFSALLYVVLLWLSLVAGFSATGHWD
jgi:hypothetical protein